MRLTGTLLFGERFQTRLASELGLTVQFVSRVLQGAKPLPPAQRRHMARVCQQFLLDFAKRKQEIEILEREWRERMEAKK